MTDTDSSAPDAYFSNDAATFGDRVAAGRRRLGLSQEDICRKMGIKLKTLRAWEEDRSEPRANKVQMLAGLLSVSLVWLLIGEGEGVAGPSDIPASDSTAPSELVIKFRAIRTGYAELNRRLARLEKRMIAAGM